MLGLIVIAAGALTLSATPMAPLVPSIETGILEESVILGPSIAAWFRNAMLLYG